MADNNTVTIVIGARANVDTGFARIRTAGRNLARSLNENFGQAGRNSGMSFTDRFRNVLSQGMATMTQAGGGLAQSLGSSLSAAGSSPAVMAGVAALALVVGSALGALLASAIVLAFGGAFVGLGVMLLAGREDVQRKWGQTLNDLKKKFSDAAKPLLPVLDTARQKLAELGDKFAPHFKKAMERAAPYIDDFLDRFAKGVEKFGEGAFEPMMEAFNELLGEIDIEGFLAGLGDAFGKLADMVKKNKKEIGLLFDFIGYVVIGAILVLGKLVGMWGSMVRAVKTAIARVQDLLSWLSRLKNKTVRFSAPGLSALIRAVRTAIDWVRNLRGKRLGFSISGISGAISAVRTLIGWIGRLHGKNITVSVGAQVGKTLTDILGRIGFAHGGIVGAASGGARSALTMVGEHGPELVRLPPGSQVHSNPDSMRMMSREGSNRTVIEIRSGGSRVDDLLVDILKKAIRYRGGDVQGVLGT